MLPGTILYAFLSVVLATNDLFVPSQSTSFNLTLFKRSYDLNNASYNPTIQSPSLSCSKFGSIATLYSVFLSDYYKGQAHIDGRIACKGNIDITSGTTIGTSLNSNGCISGGTDPLENVLVSGSGINFPNGKAQGSIIHNSDSTNVPPTVYGGNFAPGCHLYRSSHCIDFDTQLAYLAQLSSYLAQYQSKSTYTVLGQNLQCTLNSQADYHIVNLDSASLKNITAISLVNWNQDIDLIFNVKGQAISLPEISSTNLMNCRSVVWNFYQATTVLLGCVKLNGVILAPNAAVSTTSLATVNGRIYAKSIDGPIQVPYVDFAGCLPCPPTHPECSVQNPCILSGFSPWSVCSAPCGGGKQSRQRIILQTGSNCSNLVEFQQCNTQPCPTDCVLSDWSSFTACSASCGTQGIMTRTRNVINAPANGGAACAATVDTVPCNRNPCPVDCVVSAWQNVSTCSQPCGSNGVQVRARQIITFAQNGGRSCPPLEIMEPCNRFNCPTDCVVSDFSSFSPCSVPCNGGLQYRNRSILVQPSPSGKPCPPLLETTTCNQSPCPVDCAVSDWGIVSNCSAPCGGGTQSRSRTVLMPAQNGGLPCPALTEVTICHTAPCPVDCVVSDWVTTVPCSTDCGSGTMVRTRNIIKKPLYGGKSCPVCIEQVPCSSQACPIDCVVGPWSEPSPCTNSCGGGTQRMTRLILMQPQFGGLQCPVTTLETPCNVAPCPIDCSVSDWTPWSDCCADCGGGNQTRTRRAVTSPAYGGNPCPNLIDTQQCNSNPCPIDCVVSDFGPFTACSATCGGGTQSRSRAILTQPMFNGQSCPPLVEVTPCNTFPCKLSCEVSSWSDYSECDKPCGNGTKFRTRSILQQATDQSSACATTLETISCNTFACPIDCTVSDWSAWSACSHPSCGGGTMIRTRKVLTINANGGKSCPALVDTSPCNANPCPLDCVVGEWSPYGNCTASCGGGTKTRQRPILISPAFNGNSCPTTVETVACNTVPCAVDCVVTDWSSFTACSKTCGEEYQTRKRDIIIPSQNGGAACPVLQEVQSCSLPPCPVDCVLGPFGNYSQCSQPCAGGTMSRSRDIIVAPQLGGALCPEIVETVNCNTSPCPVDCIVSNWSAYCPCSAACGGGIQTRRRTVLVAPQYGGQQCPTLTEDSPCNINPCPLDCVMSQWSDYGACDKACGGGTKTRKRKIVQQPQYGGLPCGPDTEVTICNDCSCPIDCQVSDFGPFSACSQNCGGGFQTRQRLILQKPSIDGNPCPALIDSVPCNVNPCPQDCLAGPWSEFCSCSVTCGGGVQNRTRNIVVQSMNGGLPCPPTVEVKTCNTQPCAQDCVVTGWTDWNICSKPCGTGQQSRKRSVLQDSKYGGSPCPPLEQIRACNEQGCPQNCVVSNFSNWTPCSNNGLCGVAGRKYRTRTVLSCAKFGGQPCPVLEEYMDCPITPCPIHCDVSCWTPWSKCSSDCGTGTQQRTRTVTRDAAYGGLPCPTLSEQRTCNTFPCPVDCSVSPWTPFGQCSQLCNGGIQQRTRSVVVPQNSGGAPCPQLIESKSCNEQLCPVDCRVSDWTVGECSAQCNSVPCFIQPCPVDCEVGDFTEWSACSANCGPGIQLRNRAINTQPMYGGDPCPPLNETRPCNLGQCNVDCKVSDWSQFSDCSKSCGGGVRSRVRTVVTLPQAHGSMCPPLTEVEVCNTDPCAIDCVVSAWSDFSSCTARCGGGLQTRTRKIERFPTADGKQCPNEFLEQITCNVQPCPLDCVLSDWSSWSNCSAICDGGIATRSRVILREASNGGRECQSLEETQSCNQIPCPKDCVVSEWMDSCSCSAPCGPGTVTRHREILVQPQHGGNSCPQLTLIGTCNLGPCPQDCVLTPWGEFSECSVPCGGGTKRRMRSIIKPSIGNGAACPELEQYVHCNTLECPTKPVDCMVSDFTAWTLCTAPCGGGIMSRTRTILQQPSSYGQPCPVLQEIDTCNEFSCSQAFQPAYQAYAY